jgi:hypothetical protein
MKNENTTSRRDFAKAVAALALVPGVTTAGEADAPATPADALFEIAKLRYGKHLTEEQLQQVKQSLQRDQAIADFLRRSKLTNGDEPAFVFQADVP